MTSRAYHHKPNGTTYVYEVHSYWDKEKNGPRNKQICLGKLDPATGEIIPSKRRRKLTAAASVPTPSKASGQGTTVSQETQAQVAPGISATVLVAGPSLLLDKLAKDTGLASLIRRCFPDFHQEILSLVYFIVQKGLPLSRSESWSTSHLHPMGKPMASQRISELLLQINESDRQNFLSLWLKKITDSEYLCYDLTSVSSYAKDNEYIEYGYNRDGESLPQLNLAMLFGQKSGLPAYYRRMPGNINDVSTLKTTMLNLDFLGTRGLHFVLDRGFYSQANVNELLAHRQHFTMAVPSKRKWIEGIIDLYRDSIEYPNNYHQLSDHETLFVKTHLHEWGEDRRRTYLHIYYNAKRAAEDFDRFTSDLLKFKQEVESGKKVVAHQTDYDRFLIIRQTPKRGLSVSFNEPEIRAYRKRYVGFFCILSSNIKNPMEVLQIYRDKDVVEKCFDDLKNQLDMKRLRVHTSAAMDTRIFLQFLATILISRIRNISRTDGVLKNLTAREIIDDLETVVKITYSRRYKPLYTETNRMQKKIMATFGINLPS